jgi:hypothetical protein
MDPTYINCPTTTTAAPLAHVTNACNTVCNACNTVCNSTGAGRHGKRACV